MTTTRLILGFYLGLLISFVLAWFGAMASWFHWWSYSFGLLTAANDLAVFSGLVAITILTLLLTLPLPLRWLKLTLCLFAGLAILGVIGAPKVVLSIGWLPLLAQSNGVWGLLSLTLLGLILFGAIAQTIVWPLANLWWRSANFTLALSSVYLWLFAYLYQPGLLLLGLTFLVTILWALAIIASLKKKSLPTLALWSALGLILVSLVGVYLVTMQTMAEWQYARGQALLRAGNLAAAKPLFQTATGWGQQDFYYRALADLDNFYSRQLTGNDKVASLNEAITAAGHAVAKNPASPDNWLSRGDVYRSMMSLGVTTAASRAEADYQQALKLDPANLTALFDLASLAAAGGDTTTARSYLAQALNHDPNFVPGLFLLGYLDYQAKNWSAAIANLSRVVELSPNYSDAKYFLGLSYHANKQTALARQQFQELLKLNPGNQEVQKTLNSWSAGS